MTSCHGSPGKGNGPSSELVFHHKGPRKPWGVLLVAGGGDGSRDPGIKPGIEASAGNLSNLKKKCHRERAERVG